MKSHHMTIVAAIYAAPHIPAAFGLALAVLLLLAAGMMLLDESRR